MKYQKAGFLFAAAFALVISPVSTVRGLGAADTNTNAPQRWIITFDASVDDSKVAAAKNAGADPVKKLGLVNALVVNAPDAAVVQKLKKLDGVKAVEEDARVHALARPTKTATTTSTPQQLPWGVDRIDAEQSWATSRGDGIKVAVIDSGIDKDHPDLVGNIAGGVNFTRTSKSPKAPIDPSAWDDNNGHGTHVAGTVAAVDNTTGVIGVAPNASLYGVKALDSRGSGYLSDIISGIEWSINNKMHVINMSLGVGSDNQSFRDAVNKANGAGIIVIAAAGNSGDGDASTNDVQYPAKYESVIAVAATDSADKVATFSSDGAEVEIAAPGVNVLSTTMGGGYGTMNGTSMASPHVAGVAAAILASPIRASADTDGNGVWSNSEVRAVLQSTTDDLGVAGRDVFYGYGLADAAESVTGIQ